MFKQFIFSAALTLFTFSAVQADDFKAEIKQAEWLGEEIYNQDIAAWVATDELLAFFEKNPDFESQNIGGWISYGEGKRFKTVFFDKGNVNPKAVYEVISKKRKVKNANAVDRALSEQEMGLWRIRTMALPPDLEVCAQYTPYNMAIIEKQDGSGYFKYLLAATSQHDLMVLGRHYRLDISKDNDEIRDIHAFSNSCFALPTKIEASGIVPVGLMATHLVTDYPQEHHVFANLMWNIPLYVSTSKTGQNWVVKDGEIDKVK